MKRTLCLTAILLAACSGGGSQLSLSARAGSSTAAAATAPNALTLSNGINIDRVRVAIREVELERASATQNDVADAEEFEAGPFVLDLPSGALNGTVQQIMVNDVPAGTTVALVVLFGPLGFLKHGKNAKIKQGTRIKVYTDEEKKVQMKA